MIITVANNTNMWFVKYDDPVDPNIVYLVMMQDDDGKFEVGAIYDTGKSFEFDDFRYYEQNTNMSITYSSDDLMCIANFLNKLQNDRG